MYKAYFRVVFMPVIFATASLLRMPKPNLVVAFKP